MYPVLHPWSCILKAAHRSFCAALLRLLAQARVWVGSAWSMADASETSQQEARSFTLQLARLLP